MYPNFINKRYIQRDKLKISNAQMLETNMRTFILRNGSIYLKNLSGK